MGSIENIVDDTAFVAILNSRGKIQRKQVQGKPVNGPQHMSKIDWTDAWSGGTDAVMDIPIGGVCEVLYG